MPVNNRHFFIYSRNFLLGAKATSGLVISAGFDGRVLWIYVYASFGHYDDNEGAYVSMDLTPWEAFDRHIKFSNFAGNELDINEEEFLKKYNNG